MPTACGGTPPIPRSCASSAAPRRARSTPPRSSSAGSRAGMPTASASSSSCAATTAVPRTLGLLVWDRSTWEQSTIRDAAEPEVELGWTLVREHWGNGYATEAARAARDWAWKTVGVERLDLARRPRERPLDPGRGAARGDAGRDGDARGQADRRVGASAMSFLPLAGKRVVDVTSSLAGPSCTQLLASLGADVVKIEPPGGDHARAWGPPFVDGEGAMFLASNAGKQSLALDLSTPEGLDELLRLVDRADVFVQSLRPGAAEQHGIGAGDAPRAPPRARLLLDRRVRLEGAAPRPAGLRPAPPGGERDHERHRRGRDAARAGRRVAHRPLHRALGGVRDRRRTRARRRSDDRGLAVRDGALAALVPDRRLPRDGRDPRPRGQRLRPDRAVPGLPHARRRADDRRRQRQALPRAVRRARASRRTSASARIPTASAHRAELAEIIEDRTAHMGRRRSCSTRSSPRASPRRPCATSARRPTTSRRARSASSSSSPGSPPSPSRSPSTASASCTARRPRSSATTTRGGHGPAR